MLGLSSLPAKISQDRLGRERSHQCRGRTHRTSCAKPDDSTYKCRSMGKGKDPCKRCSDPTGFRPSSLSSARGTLQCEPPPPHIPDPSPAQASPADSPGSSAAIPSTGSNESRISTHLSRPSGYVVPKEFRFFHPDTSCRCHRAWFSNQFRNECADCDRCRSAWL